MKYDLLRSADAERLMARAKVVEKLREVTKRLTPVALARNAAETVAGRAVRLLGRPGLSRAGRLAAIAVGIAALGLSVGIRQRTRKMANKKRDLIS